MMRGMVIDMNDKQLATLAQLQAFLDGTTAVDFAVAPDERYDFIARAFYGASAIAVCREPTRAWCYASWSGSAAIRASN